MFAPERQQVWQQYENEISRAALYLHIDSAIGWALTSSSQQKAEPAFFIRRLCVVASLILVGQHGATIPNHDEIARCRTIIDPGNAREFLRRARFDLQNSRAIQHDEIA